MQNKVPDGVLRCLKGLETAYSNYIDPFRLTLQIQTFALDRTKGPKIGLKNGQKKAKKADFHPKFPFFGLDDVFYAFFWSVSTLGSCLYSLIPFLRQKFKK